MLKRTLAILILPVALAAPARPGKVTAEHAGITVVTLNMAKEPAAARIVEELSATPALRQADVFLLQEVKQERGRPSTAEAVGAAMGMHAVYAAAADGADDRGLAILSRYPLTDVRIRPLPAFHLRFHSRMRFAIEATALAPTGPVRILNAHLDTRLNIRDRLAQLQPVLADAREFRGPRIIGGDFNSNGFYWLGHVAPVPAWNSQANGVYQSLTHAGLRTAIPLPATTLDYLGMHLDWIWLAGAKPRDYRVYPLAFSDHHAVWARVEF